MVLRLGLCVVGLALGVSGCVTTGSVAPGISPLEGAMIRQAISDVCVLQTYYSQHGDKWQTRERVNPQDVYVRKITAQDKGWKVAKVSIGSFGNTFSREIIFHQGLAMAGCWPDRDKSNYARSMMTQHIANFAQPELAKVFRGLLRTLDGELPKGENILVDWHGVEKGVVAFYVPYRAGEERFEGGWIFFQTKKAMGTCFGYHEVLKPPPNPKQTWYFECVNGETISAEIGDGGAHKGYPYGKGEDTSGRKVVIRME